MFSSCKESTGKSLADHLPKDGSRLIEGIDSPQAGLQAWIRVRVKMLGLFWALIRLGILSGDVGPKSMVPTMSHFFRLGSSISPVGKILCF